RDFERAQMDAVPSTGMSMGASANGLTNPISTDGGRAPISTDGGRAPVGDYARVEQSQPSPRVSFSRTKTEPRITTPAAAIPAVHVPVEADTTSQIVSVGSVPA